MLRDELSSLSGTVRESGVDTVDAAGTECASELTRAVGSKDGS